MWPGRAGPPRAPHTHKHTDVGSTQSCQQLRERGEVGEICEGARGPGVTCNRPLWRGFDTQPGSGSQLTESPAGQRGG